MMVLPALIGLALLLRFWTIGNLPLHPDEIHYVFDYMVGEETGCLSSIRGLDCSMLVERRSAHPMLVPLLTRWLWFLPLGWAVDWTPGFWRGFNALVGSLTVVPAWLVGRLLGGRLQGFFAALFVAIGPALVWTSRTAYLDPVYTFFIASWLAAVAWSWRGGGVRAIVLQGVFFGLLFSTKISAPLLLPPFLAGLFLAPAGTSTRQRIEHLLLGSGIAFFLWVLLCDPGSYWGAIFEPSDIRYADTWERERFGGALNLVFVDLNYYFTTLIWDTPITAPIFAAMALYLVKSTRNGYTLLLVFTVVCLAPLLLLHHPRLSGRHGFMPIQLLLALLASHAAFLPRRWMLGGLGAMILLAGTSIAIHPFRDMPFSPRSYNALEQDALYDLMSPYIHQRHPSLSLVVVPGEGFTDPWIVTIRNGQLAEGAIVYLAPPRSRSRPNNEAWQWADLVVVADEMEDVMSPVPDSFTRQARNDEEGLTLYMRTNGEARRSISLGDLPEDGNGGHLVVLPGNVHPISGRVRHGEDWLTHPSGKSSFFEGPFMVTGGDGGDLLEIYPPSRRDVLWGF
ncbi:MAG: glycosyltransferase family 39 protein [Candidatus Sumerlaeia bacterium]|nr:glycosyltransferase family 39 protein [Candidatus Sumerlaeia bacterium]